MDQDDRQIGRILSRREVLKLFGATGAGLLVGCAPTQSSAPTGAGTQATAASAAPVQATSAPAATANSEAATAAALETNPTAQATAAAEVAAAETANATTAPACVVRPEATEGPYYVDENLVRSDIRSDPTTGTVKEGAPLVLTFHVSQISTGSCTPLANAEVEIWHCDALGVYSDVTDRSFSTVGQQWLRGSQMTDAQGKATFTTIYPGWYPGRAVHIHFKVRPNQNSVFTSQLFFDDMLSQQVFSREPYASKGSTQDTLNSTDGIYQDLLLLTTAQTSEGYAATFPIGIDVSTLGSGTNRNPGSGGPGLPPPRN